MVCFNSRHCQVFCWLPGDRIFSFISLPLDLVKCPLATQLVVQDLVHLVEEFIFDNALEYCTRSVGQVCGLPTRSSRLDERFSLCLSMETLIHHWRYDFSLTIISCCLCSTSALEG